MKAIVYDRYGAPELLRLEEVPLPVVGPRDVLVRIAAASVNSWDWENLLGVPQARLVWGLRRPKLRILGADVAGVVEAVGRDVQRFRVGDEVYGDLCECAWGGFAEYAIARETALASKPQTMTFEQAAAIPQAGGMALQGLRDYGKLEAGQHVLINGAGGGVGSFAIQLAKAMGAEVTGVDAAHKLEFMQRLGADHVVDFTREDVAATRVRYDLILDVRASRSMFEWRKLLCRTGKYFLIGGHTARILQLLALGSWLKLSRCPQRMGLVVYRPNAGLDFLEELFEAGKVIPALDRVFALRDTRDALRLLGEGKALGKVVVNTSS